MNDVTRFSIIVRITSKNSKHNDPKYNWIQAADRIMCVCMRAYIRFNYPTCFKHPRGYLSFTCRKANSNKFDYLISVPKLKIVCANALRIKIVVARARPHLHRKRNRGKRKHGYTGRESFYGNSARILLGENPLVRWVSREQTSRARERNFRCNFRAGIRAIRAHEGGGGGGGRGRGGKNCSTRDRKRFANVQSTRGRFAFTRFEAIQFR